MRHRSKVIQFSFSTSVSFNITGKFPSILPIVKEHDLRNLLDVSSQQSVCSSREAKTRPGVDRTQRPSNGLIGNVLFYLGRERDTHRYEAGENKSAISTPPRSSKLSNGQWGTSSKISRLSRGSRTRSSSKFFPRDTVYRAPVRETLPLARSLARGVQKKPGIFVRSTCRRNGRSGFFCLSGSASDFRPARIYRSLTLKINRLTLNTNTVVRWLSDASTSP